MTLMKQFSQNLKILFGNKQLNDLKNNKPFQIFDDRVIEFFDDWVGIVVKATVKAVKDYERLNPLRNANRNVSRDLASFQQMVEYIDDLLFTAPKINK